MALAYDELPEVKAWIVGTILRMRMPIPDGIGVPATVDCTHADARTPAASAVRRALLDDEDLHADIAEEVYVSLHRRTQRGPVDHSEIRPLLYVVTQRATRRHVRRHALKEMARVLFGPDARDVDAIGGADLPIDDLLAERQEHARLGVLMQSLPASERRLLEATASGRYQDAAKEFGITPKAVRNRACLLRKRLRGELATVRPA